MTLNKSGFQSIVRRILSEELEKSTAGNDEKIYKRLPEVSHDKDYKKIIPHERDTKSKEELIVDLTKTVKAVDNSFVVEYDDHDDISINNARDLFRIRVIPKWENNYCIEAYTRNEDRIYVTGQSWDQVKEFVKQNLKNCKTNTEKAWDKVGKNREDQTATNDKGMPQKDKPKILPLTDEEPKVAKNKDKNYTEKPKDDDDLPDKSMKEVKDGKKLIDYKVKAPVKLKQKNPDAKLTIKMDKQATSKF